MNFFLQILLNLSVRVLVFAIIGIVLIAESDINLSWVVDRVVVPPPSLEAAFCFSSSLCFFWRARSSARIWSLLRRRKLAGMAVEKFQSPVSASLVPV